MGNPTKLIRPHWPPEPGQLFEKTVYDANNQVLEQHGAFDPQHENLRYRDPAVTYLRYDPLGRMEQQSAPTREGEDVADWTNLTYYDSGEIKTSTDPWNISTSYEYDKLGLQTKRVLKGASGEATRTMTWSYHPDGSLDTRYDAAASSATTVDKERSFKYSYDADGRTTRVDDTTPGGALIDAFVTLYDEAGRVERVEERDGSAVRRTTSYTYDLNGNTTSVEASRGEVVGAGDEGNLMASRFTAYTWDERDLVKTVTAGKSPSAATLRTWAYTYDPRGMKATWTKPNAAGEAAGNLTTYAYHESGLLRRMVERNPRLPDNPVVASHQLWFNPDGDRTRDISRVDNADTAGNLDQTATYKYTPERKLAEVAKSGTNKSKNETYLYDDAGNVEEQTVDGTTTEFVYVKNRLTKATASKPGATAPSATTTTTRSGGWTTSPLPLGRPWRTTPTTASTG